MFVVILFLSNRSHSTAEVGVRMYGDATALLWKLGGRCKPEFSAQCAYTHSVGVGVGGWVCMCVGVGVHVSSFLLLYRMCITHFKWTVSTEASSHA